MFRKRDGLWWVWGEYKGFVIHLGRFRTYEAAKKQLEYMNKQNRKDT